MSSSKRVAMSVFAAIGSFFIFAGTMFGAVYKPDESGSVTALISLAISFGGPIFVGIYTNKKLKYKSEHPELLSKEQYEKLIMREEGRRERAEATEEMKRERDERRAVVQREKDLNKKEKERKKGERDAYGTLTLVGGLGDLPQGSNCQVVYNSTRIKFTASGQDFVLDASKLLDVSVMTQKEIQKQYVSSIGGAVAGAALLGPIGAIIGGRATQKKINQVSEYLVITYMSDGETKYIVFDVTNSPFIGSGIRNRYKHLKKNENLRVEL